MADDYIDSRDLVDEMASIMANGGDAEDEEQAERVAAIVALFDEITGYAGDSPEDGIFLIADEVFVDYAQQLADDIGAIDTDAGWPTSYIDWEAAATALQMDYSSVVFDGRDYWYR